MMQKRPAAERGHVQLGWLDTWHSFSFSEYYDPKHVHFGSLRVINDDRIAASAGFGMHPHRDMEIVTYMLSGALRHHDSMGNSAVIETGYVQRMSAGTGITHSEFNARNDAEAHLLQIWLFPEQKDLTPGYEEIMVSDDAKRGKLALIAAREAPAGVLTLHQDVMLYAGCFDAHETAEVLMNATRRYYLHLARGELKVNGEKLQAGDALMFSNEESVLRFEHGQHAEVLLFDLA